MRVFKYETRGQNWNIKETNALWDSVKRLHSILFGDSTRKKRFAAWVEVTKCVNKFSTIKRTVENVRKKYTRRNRDKKYLKKKKKSLTAIPGISLKKINFTNFTRSANVSSIYPRRASSNFTRDNPTNFDAPPEFLKAVSTKRFQKNHCGNRFQVRDSSLSSMNDETQVHDLQQNTNSYFQSHAGNILSSSYSCKMISSDWDSFVEESNSELPQFSKNEFPRNFKENNLLVAGFAYNSGPLYDLLETSESDSLTSADTIENERNFEVPGTQTNFEYHEKLDDAHFKSVRRMLYPFLTGNSVASSDEDPEVGGQEINACIKQSSAADQKTETHERHQKILTEILGAQIHSLQSLKNIESCMKMFEGTKKHLKRSAVALEKHNLMKREKMQIIQAYSRKK